MELSSRCCATDPVLDLVAFRLIDDIISADSKVQCTGAVDYKDTPCRH